jgi:hypothetical protein
MGEGLYDIPMMLRQLQKMSFNGFISLEDLGGAVSTCPICTTKHDCVCSSSRESQC